MSKKQQKMNTSKERVDSIDASCKGESAGSVLNLENGSTITLVKTDDDEPITGNGVYWFQD